MLYGCRFCYIFRSLYRYFTQPLFPPVFCICDRFVEGLYWNRPGYWQNYRISECTCNKLYYNGAKVYCFSFVISEFMILHFVDLVWDLIATY